MFLRDMIRLKKGRFNRNVIMYGTNACPDCVNAETILKEKNIQYLLFGIGQTISEI